jgi:septal ring factor EnvC (AmiA/AmiB activator)
MVDQEQFDKTIASLKEHIDEKFKNHELLEAVRHDRVNEILAQFGKDRDDSEETVRRIHTRVDRIETKIKTVQGMGATLATVVAMVLAWLGLHNK